MLSFLRPAALVIFALMLVSQAHARTFHLDSRDGDDAQDGTTEQTAWRSLNKADAADYQPGDQLLLRRGSQFKGTLKLTLKGTAEKPIVIGAYGEGAAPIIDGAGCYAGVRLTGSHYVQVRDMEITADGGTNALPSEKYKRFGVLVEAGQETTSHITLENLTIHHIFPEVGTKNEGRNPTTYLGTGIALAGNQTGESADFIVRNCRISMTGFKAISLSRVNKAQVLDNDMKDIGGPAIQPGRVNDLLVRGNTVDGSGSNKDPRMHMRGSGIWPWTCNRVLIEHNRFMHARGKADSCGIHIDFNCSDVVVQYNLSVDNAGGFIEILGNNHNCAYRYNISVNDGRRVKGRDGAAADGKILLTSGDVGRGGKSNGPYNSYIYNNTIYVQPDSVSRMSLAPTTEGLLIANNIFRILGKTHSGSDRKGERIPRSLMAHNLFVTDAVLPGSFAMQNKDPIIGDPQFTQPGGFDPKDYIPRNVVLIKDRGIEIEKLPGDDVGLRIGLKVEKDFLGNPIVGKPDLGAIELP